jgi:mannose-6-phosphate isomerase
VAQNIQASLNERADAGRRWLFEAALPLWRRNGYDQSARCFHESLDQGGAPTAAPRRIRSQARQTFAFARAGVMGWDGPWRDACEAGVAVLLQRGVHPDGGTRHALGPDGAPNDERRDLYDLSCVLLALAEAARALERGELLAAAEGLIAWADKHWTQASGGYREGEIETARRQNPHMHMVEALLDLHAASGDARYLERADRVARLMAGKMFNVPHRALPEYFDDALRPLAGETGRNTEPGHAFEWCWLLDRLCAAGGANLTNVGDALYAQAEQFGVDATRGIIFDEVFIDGAPSKRTSRLWPHTERLKANLSLYERNGDELAARRAIAAYDAFRSYCDAAAPGLWQDRKDANGEFIPGDAPSSTLYHAVTAISELERVSGGSGASR